MSILDLCRPGERFIVETVVGPYIAEWRVVDGLAATVFISPLIPGEPEAAAPMQPRPHRNDGAMAQAA